MRELLRIALARLREFSHRSNLETERDEEFHFHLEMETASNLRRGMSEVHARRAAILAFGGVERFREETRAARGMATLDNLGRDLKFAFRRLQRSPGFSIGVMATLGIGVGISMAIAVLVYGVLLRPLPFSRADRLVHVAFVTPGLDGGRERAHSRASYVHIREFARSFLAFGAYHVNEAVNLTDGDEPQRVTAVMASPGLFAALGVSPALGRLHTDADAREGVVVPVVISHELWRRRYSADSSLVDRLIEINRLPRRVIGVLPRAFAFPTPAAAVWFPLQLDVERPTLNNRYLIGIARLRDGYEIDDAASELRAIIRRFPERFPRITRDELDRSGARAEVQELKAEIVAPVVQHLRLLAVTMVLVLLIAIANVASLFLLRAERLRQEVAITIALGGGWVALVRRFVVEGVVLGAFASVVALPILVVAVRWRFGFSTREIPRLHEIVPSPWTLTSAASIAVAIGALIGFIAFLRVGKSPLHNTLHSAQRVAGGTAWRRAQQTLVALQVAIALALMLSAALLGSSLWNLRRVNLGFIPERHSSFEVTLPYSGYSNYAQVAAFHTGVLDRLRAMRGIEAAEAAMEIPLNPAYPGELTLEIDGRGTDRSERAAINMVSADYFRLMAIPLLHGRSFTAGDVRSRTPGIVLSASLARSLFGTTDAVGREVRPPSPGADVFFRVVGIVGDVPRWRIEDGPVSMAYFPLLRDADGIPADSVRIPISMGTAWYVLRSETPIAQLATTIRASVRQLDARVPLTNFTSLPAMVDAATARVRLTMLLLSVSAAAALLLGIVGIYGVVSYAVAGRKREFGVRLALGATPSGISCMVLREGTILAIAGVGVGIVAAQLGAQIARSMLYGVSPTDPLLNASVTTVLLVIVGAAALPPARRAARLDPAEVMRGD